MTIIEKLEQRRNYHQERATALQLAIDELQDGATVRAKASLNGKLKAAITARRILTAQPRKHPARKTSGAEKGALTRAAVYVLNQAKGPLEKGELRERIEERLGKKITHSTGFGSLVRYGYMKMTKDGYVSTGKEWSA